LDRVVYRGNGHDWGSSTNPNVATDPLDFPGFADIISPAGGDVLPWLLPNGLLGGQMSYDCKSSPKSTVGIISAFQGININGSG
jgi:hypothetical protein